MENNIFKVIFPLILYLLFQPYFNKHVFFQLTSNKIFFRLFVANYNTQKKSNNNKLNNY